MTTILLLKDTVSTKYVVHALTPTWRELGYRVVEHAGLRRLPDADLVFLHVDRTIVPDDYAAACARYPAAVNARALDVSRRRYSPALLSEHDAYDGPVIVKTDANCGGAPERRDRSWPVALAKRVETLVDRMLRGRVGSGMAADDPRWAHLDHLRPRAYPRFDRRSLVPPGVWRNPKLIVERFLPEREGDLFFVRYWTFLGGQEMSGRYGSKDPIVKFGGQVTPDEPVAVPPELRRWREALGMDYGRFDYVMHEGRPVLLDVNKTMGGGDSLEAYREPFATLATGIRDFLQ
ncbi:MAG TPA: hypothetical protein PK725_16885 [Rhodocyclaceae bacterium]|nr:hypothetical protein [Rhodocyclaceae bacterium]